MLIPKDFLDIEFGKTVAFGYKTADVDAFVDMAIELLKAFEKENIQLKEDLDNTNAELQKYRDDEQTIYDALIGYQKLGDSFVKNAKIKAQEIVDQATQQADLILHDVSSRRKQEQTRYQELRDESAKFKNELFRLYKEHLEIIQQIPDAPEIDDEDSSRDNDDNFIITRDMKKENKSEIDKRMIEPSEEEKITENIETDEEIENIVDKPAVVEKAEVKENSQVLEESQEQKDEKSDEKICEEAIEEETSPKISEDTSVQIETKEEETEEEDTFEGESVDKLEPEVADSTPTEMKSTEEQEKQEEPDEEEFTEKAVNVEEHCEKENDNKLDDGSDDGSDDEEKESSEIKVNSDRTFDALICEQVTMGESFEEDDKLLENSVILDDSDLDEENDLFLDDLKLENVIGKNMDLFNEDSDDDDDDESFSLLKINNKE